MAGLAGPLSAQTPPVPNFGLTLRPEFRLNVWPADFNRDGRTDLVAATGRFNQPSTQLTVALGRGDGSFTAARSLGIAAVPLNVGDFNADGSVDVVIRRGDSLEVLPGRGDGTFAAPRVVAPTGAFTDEVRIWAYVTDLDGDIVAIGPKQRHCIEGYAIDAQLGLDPNLVVERRGSLAL